MQDILSGEDDEAFVELTSLKITLAIDTYLVRLIVLPDANLDRHMACTARGQRHYGGGT